ncbi:flippase [Methanimicrococcus blatticola]|uniref:O-antigen/teichoic acid export membrane protein n=1 Tax=Methanimicrococcus blatticola TaxID=91560 RepID=A0A484F2G2_9EURY|nr:flippase [Methanimicrococcus blatticola]MBZ3935381.1 flippase [Methanimicrococcus blatticola]MCC2508521.1 flippase [Methanimicrococcus blatticola]TDQ67830.1 O-antigen/teichoic acid export membrane protein [Methanimicrococcus blatticola]
MAQTADIFSNIGKKKGDGNGGNENAGNRNAVHSQTLVSLLSQFGLTAIGFLSTIYFTRVVNPAIVGVYFLFFSYSALFYLFSESGIGESSVKLISEGKARNEYYTASMALRAVYLILCVAGLLISAVIFPTSTIMETGIFWWIIAALFIDYFYNSRIYAAYADGKINAFQVSLFLNTAVRSLFQIGIVYLGYHSFGLMGGFLVGMIFAAIFAHRYNQLKLVKFSKENFKRILTYAVLIFLVMSCYLIYQNIDVVFIGRYMTETDAGIYRIVYQFSMLAGLAATSVKAVLYPKFSAWNETKQYENITEGLRSGTSLSLMLAIPIFFSFLILGYDFISLFYGEAYIPGVPALFLLSFIQIITVFMYLQSICLNAISHPKYAFLSIAAGITANVILNIVLIPVYGMEGAALATVIAMLLNSALAYLLLRKVIPIRYNWISILKMVIASLLMCVFLLGFKYVLPITNVIYLLTAFVVGGLLYGLIMLKADRAIHDEVAEMVTSFGVKWPKWL